MATKLDTSIYNRGQRRNTIGDVLSGIQGVSNLVGKAKARKQTEEAAEENEYLNTTFGKHLSGWDGQDRVDFSTRSSAAMNEILDTNPKLYSQVVPEIEKAAKSTRDAEKFGTEMAGKVEDNKAKVYDTGIKREALNKYKYENMWWNTKRVAEVFSEPVTDENDFNNRVDQVDELGIPHKLDYQRYIADPGSFINQTELDKARAEKKLKGLEVTGKESDVEGQNLSNQQAKKDLGWTDELNRATIDRKGRSGSQTLASALEGVDIEGVDPTQILAVWEDMTKRLGVRGAKVAIGLAIPQLKAGKTADQIGDSTTYAGQSPEYVGMGRDFVSSQFIGKEGGNNAKAAHNHFDNLLASGDRNATSTYAKQLIKTGAGNAKKNKITDMERTVQFVGEIRQDLKDFEAAGGSTGIFNGTHQAVLNKVGRVGNAKMREIAQRIQMAINTYRYSVSGAAFTESEGKSYKKLFPSQFKTSGLNMADLNALEGVFSGHVKAFYVNNAGEPAYDAFIQGGYFDGDKDGGEDSSTSTIKSDSGNVYNLD